MILVVIVGAVVALVLFPTFRCAVLHPFLLVWSGARDLFFYFKHRNIISVPPVNWWPIPACSGAARPFPLSIKWSVLTGAITAKRFGAPAASSLLPSESR